MNTAAQPWDAYFASLGQPLRDAVGQFESLGQNCEFTFVQHANGFGEGGLLSWALSDNADAVTMLLRQSFVDLFARERLEPVGPGNLLRDQTYGLAFHSTMLVRREGGVFVPTPEAERNAIYAADIAKFRYLSAKMQSQLTAGQRIWVFKSLGPMGLGQMLTLHGALNRYGRNRLLVVLQTPALAGQVEMLDQDLFLGHLKTQSPGAEAWKFDPECWGKILRATLRLAG